MSGGFAIVDTNVLVAGLLTDHADSPLARVLDAMLGAKFSFVVSEALLAEYRSVLLRPRLRKLHGLSTDEVELIPADVARHAIVLAPVDTAVVVAPDPDDQFLWNLLAARADLVLVAGDKLLLIDPVMRQRVMSPQQFAPQLRR